MLVLLVPFPSTIQLNAKLLLITLDMHIVPLMAKNTVLPRVTIAGVALQKRLDLRPVTQSVLPGCAKLVNIRVSEKDLCKYCLTVYYFER